MDLRFMTNTFHAYLYCAMVYFNILKANVNQIYVPNR